MLAPIALVVINGVAGRPPGPASSRSSFDLIVPAGASLLGLISVGLVFGAGRDGRKPAQAGALGLCRSAPYRWSSGLCSLCRASDESCNEETTMPGVEEVKLHIAASVDEAERAIVGMRGSSTGSTRRSTGCG